MTGVEELRALLALRETILPTWEAYATANWLTPSAAKHHSVYVWLAQPCTLRDAELEELLAVDWGDSYLPESHPHFRELLKEEAVLRRGNIAERRLADAMAAAFRAWGREPMPHSFCRDGTWLAVPRPVAIDDARAL